VEISEVAFAYRFFNAKLRLPVLRNKSCNLLVCKDQVRSSEINKETTDPTKATSG